MKYLTYFVIMGVLVVIVEATRTSRFKSATATSFDNNSITVRYCNVKVFSRNHQDSSFNLGLTYLQPLDRPIYVSLLCEFRYGTVFREAYKTGGSADSTEWCSMMDGHTTNLAIAASNYAIKDSVPYLMHKCPYEGLLDLKNLTLNGDNFPAVFPSGTYRTTVIVSKPGKKLLRVVLTFEVKSDI